MALNITRMSEERVEAKKRATRRQAKNRKNVMRRFEPGWTKFAVCPPTPAMDGVPCVRADQHFGIAPGVKYPVYSLAADNQAIYHPQTAKMLAEINGYRADKGKHVVKLREGEECPIQQALDGTDPGLAKVTAQIDDKRAKQMGRRESYLFPIVPIAFSPLPDDGEPDEPVWKDLPVREQIPCIAPMPPTAYNQLIGKIVQEVNERDRDPTDPAAAVFFVLKYHQPGIWTYEIDLDVSSAIKPVRLPKPVRAAIKAQCVDGGDCDPYRFIAGNIKDREQLVALMKGATVEEHVETADGRPGCYGVDGEIEADDEDCQACKFKAGCAEQNGVAVPPDPGSKGAKRSPVKAPEPEPTAEDEDEDEDEEPPFDAEPADSIVAAPDGEDADSAGIEDFEAALARRRAKRRG